MLLPRPPRPPPPKHKATAPGLKEQGVNLPQKGAQRPAAPGTKRTRKEPSVPCSGLSGALTARGPPVAGRAGRAAAVRDGAVGEVAVPGAGGGARDHRGPVLRKEGAGVSAGVGTQAAAAVLLPRPKWRPHPRIPAQLQGRAATPAPLNTPAGHPSRLENQVPAASVLEWCLGAGPHQYPRSAGAPPGALPAQQQIQSSPGAASCFTSGATPLNDPNPP